MADDKPKLETLADLKPVPTPDFSLVPTLEGPKPVASIDATGTVTVESLCVFVHDSVVNSLERLGQPAPEFASVVVHFASQEDRLLREVREDTSGFGLVPLVAPPKDMAKRLALVCMEPPAPEGRAVTRPIFARAWREGLADGSTRCAAVLADKDRRFLAWIPCRIPASLLEGRSKTVTIAILSARGACLEIFIDGGLVHALSRRAKRALLTIRRDGSSTYNLHVDLAAAGRTHRPKGTFFGHLVLFAELPPPREEPAAIEVIRPDDEMVKRKGLAVEISIGPEGGGTWERRTWTGRADRVVAFRYSEGQEGAADPLEHLRAGQAQYNDAWSPKLRALWERAMTPPAIDAPGFAVSLWVCPPRVNFGDVSLAADVEAAWCAAGGKIGPVSALAGAPLGSATPLECVWSNLRAAAQGLAPEDVVAWEHGVVEAHAGVTVADVAEWAVPTVVKWASPPGPAMTFWRGAFRDAKSKVEALLKLADGAHMSGVPGSVDDYMRIVNLDGKALWGPMLAPREVVQAEAAALGAVKRSDRAARFVVAGEATRDFLHHLHTPLKYAGLALGLAAFGLNLLLQRLAAAHREEAEKNLAGLMARLSVEAWDGTQQLAAGASALAIERHLADAPDDHLRMLLATADAMAAIMAFTPLAPLGLAIDIYLALEFVHDTIIHRLPTAPKVFKRLRGAAVARFAEEALALACVQDPPAAGGVLARTDLVPEASLREVRLVWVNSIVERIRGVAAGVGVVTTVSSHDTVHGSDPAHLVRSTLERGVGFWLQRVVLYDLAAASLGEADREHWDDMLMSLLWKDTVDLTISALPASSSPDTIEISTSERGLIFRAEDLPDAPDCLGTWFAKSLGERGPVYVRARRDRLSAPWVPGHPSVRALMRRAM
jgi:hypothetical protein